MKWKTKVTELLGCKYPILQGALAGLGNWKFAAAVAEAGAYGTITASVSRTPERLREDIKRCRDATDGSFGVNLSFGSCPRIEEMLEVCIEEGVTVETAVYRPDTLASRIKESGVKWIHKTATVRHALHAERLQADAVIVVGMEGVGHKNPEQLPTMTTTVWGTRQIKIPFVAAGGIGDARGFLGALAMGADGVMMGTAFMATKECPMSELAKAAMVRARPDDPQLHHRVLGSTDPKAYEELMKMRDKMPLEQWLRMHGRVTNKDTDWKGTTDYTPQVHDERLSKVVSLAVGVIDDVPTVKGLIDNIIHGAEEILAGWQFLKGEVTDS